MSKSKRRFEPISAEQQKEYERSARLQYDPVIVNESIKLWNSYDKSKQKEIGDEGAQVYDEMVDAIEAGATPQSAEIQALIERWHEHLRYFYEPTLEILRGLGELYNTDARFMANFQKLHPNLPAFLQEAITEYVDQLEYAEIVRLLSEDEENTGKA
jgi:hypothetical protein